ncbi:MAG TPA: hypothetical protein VIY30_15595 [Burkholderiaceae bacterium]
MPNARHEHPATSRNGYVMITIALAAISDGLCGIAMPARCTTDSLPAGGFIS